MKKFIAPKTNIVKVFVNTLGHCPYEFWLTRLKDYKAQAAILSRIDRIEVGLVGDSKYVGAGIYELRIHVRPGYRIYYVKTSHNTYLILTGGFKYTQKRDIEDAKVFWQEYKTINH